MISENYHRVIRRNIKKLRRFTNRFWFPPLLLLLSLVDVLVIVIPAEGILISSSMLRKKRWLLFAISAAVGSALGSLLLINLIDLYGLEKMLEFYPGVDQTSIWKWTLNFFNQYGLWVVLFVGLTPLAQQPILAIAALSNISFLPLALVIFVSRILKFSLLAYIASHAPRFLNKLWGVKGEIKDAGIKIS